MRKPKPNRQARLRPEDLKRFPLPKNLFWMNLGTEQVVFPCWSATGLLMAAATAVLLDRNFLPPDGGDIGDPGFHTEGSGRWYRLDFPIRMPRRKCLQMVKRAVAIMSADNA